MEMIEGGGVDEVPWPRDNYVRGRVCTWTSLHADQCEGNRVSKACFSSIMIFSIKIVTINTCNTYNNKVG
jgi:hypothetical protein